MSKKMNPAVMLVVVGLAILGVAYGLREAGIWSSEGQAAVILEIVYEDGSSKMVGPVGLGAMGLKITDQSGGTISSIVVNIEARATFTGNVNGFDYSGSRVSYKIGSTSATSFLTSPDTAFSGQLISGQWVPIYSYRLTAAALSTASPLPYGPKTLYIRPYIQVSIDFTDGGSTRRDASLSAQFSYNYDRDFGFTALSIQADIDSFD